jgi:hypothetical protein
MKARGNYALLYSPLTLVAISMRANPTIAIQKVWGLKVGTDTTRRASNTDTTHSKSDSHQTILVGGFNLMILSSLPAGSLSRAPEPGAQGPCARCGSMAS